MLCVWLEHILAWNTIELPQMVKNESKRNYKWSHLAEGIICFAYKTKAKVNIYFYTVYNYVMNKSILILYTFFPKHWLIRIIESQ